MADAPVIPPTRDDTKPGKRILVTGSAGRLGMRLVKALQDDGHMVRGYDKVSEDAATIGGDLNSFGLIKRATEGADAVCHVAAIPSYNGRDVDLFGANVRGTFNAYLAAAQCKVRQFIFASSLSVLMDAGIGEVPPQEYVPMDERHPPRCQDIYGVSKLFGEELGRAYSMQHDMSVVCLRPHAIDYRPIEALEGPLPEGHVSVWDVIEAFRLALASDVRYGVYHITGLDQSRVTSARAEEELGYKPRW